MRGVFSLVHHGQRARIPQEAVIGICYAVASAASMLAMSQSTAQGEHLKDMLVGNILAVSWDEVAETAALYAAIGVFHYVYRRRFLLISMHPERAAAEGISLRLWDFIFYASFGFVVTSSVAIAGVLLVFCYLIVPSVAAMLYADRIGTQARDRLVHGDGGVGARNVLLGRARSAHGRHDRLHLRPGVDCHGCGAPAGRSLVTR